MKRESGLSNASLIASWNVCWAHVLLVDSGIVDPTCPLLSSMKAARWTKAPPALGTETHFITHLPFTHRQSLHIKLGQVKNYSHRLLTLPQAKSHWNLLTIKENIDIIKSWKWIGSGAKKAATVCFFCWVSTKVHPCLTSYPHTHRSLHELWQDRPGRFHAFSPSSYHQCPWPEP